MIERSPLAINFHIHSSRNMALHEALIALQTGCSGLLTLKQDDPHFKRVRQEIDLGGIVSFMFSVFQLFHMFIKENWKFSIV